MRSAARFPWCAPRPFSRLTPPSLSPDPRSLHTLSVHTPLLAQVRDLQRGGLDVQMIGFGLLATYHADNEYCLLSHMQKGFRVLARVVGLLDRS